jgi:hypothetical protein
LKSNVDVLHTNITKPDFILKEQSNCGFLKYGLHALSKKTKKIAEQGKIIITRGNLLAGSICLMLIGALVNSCFRTLPKNSRIKALGSGNSFMDQIRAQQALEKINRAEAIARGEEVPSALDDSVVDRLQKEKPKIVPKPIIPAKEPKFAKKERNLKDRFDPDGSPMKFPNRAMMYIDENQPQAPMIVGGGATANKSSVNVNSLVAPAKGQEKKLHSKGMIMRTKKQRTMVNPVVEANPG